VSTGFVGVYGAEASPRSKVACGKSQDKLIERANVPHCSGGVAVPRGRAGANTGTKLHAIDATRKKATRSNYSFTHKMDDEGLVVLLPVVLQADGEVLHGDALLADGPPAVPRDLY
jgi:hypothetical protein